MTLWHSPPRFKIVFRRYHAILLGNLLLLATTVTPASWDAPMQRMPRPEIRTEPKRPWIAFTFDDGPHPRMTEKLLEVLKKERVPATFFIVGKMADRHPYLVHRMAEEGHEIANHTYSHPRLSGLAPEEVLEELNQTRAVIQRLTGRDSLLFRPPGGDYTRHTVRTSSKAGYKMILWSVLTKDVQGASQSLMMKRVLNGAEDGGIVLLHSGVKTTIDAMPEMIASLRAKGYQFVTISTLMNLPGNEMYWPPADPSVQIAALLQHDVK
jgi:peptidoglycan/xylan/chitin deacetylase (PgdA/CDA1 family)